MNLAGNRSFFLCKWREVTWMEGSGSDLSSGKSMAPPPLPQPLTPLPDPYHPLPWRLVDTSVSLESGTHIPSLAP